MSTEKYALITGGNAGIGFQTALGIARAGYVTGIVSRNREKGEKALAEIKAQTGNAGLHLFVADFSDLGQVRKLAAEVLERFPRLDLLVNNAGAVHGTRTLTKEGYEMTFAVNHLAPYLLTRLLLDRIKECAPARIVNVSSGSHYKGQMPMEDLHFANRSYAIMKAYEQSKLANVLFSNELARRLEGSGVVSNALHPGVVSTGIGQKKVNFFVRMLWSLVRVFAISAKKGAQTSLHLALSEEGGKVSGMYYDNSKPRKPARLARDTELARKLWAASAEMVGLPAD